jgi:hypothetical protein
LTGLVGAAFEYMFARRGLLASNVCDVAAIVRLADADVPAIGPAYLTDPRDAERLAKGVELARDRAPSEGHVGSVLLR